MKNIDINKEIETKIPLKFNKDGSFRILMISDIHGGVGYDKEHTVAAIQALVDNTKPDLVLLGGDNAGPGIIHIETAEQLKEMLDGIASPMEKAGIPWAHVYGNHDNNFGLANKDHQPVYESFPHCVSKAGPEELWGCGNYVLPIYDENGEKILFNVFGFDTHRNTDHFKRDFGLPDEMQFYSCNNGENGNGDTIRFNQLMWYWQVSEEMEKLNGSKIPALAYMHIPLPEFDLVTHYRDKCKFEGHQLADVSCTPLNSGAFSTFLQRGDVKAIFCGHNHRNDFSAKYCGITLAYDGFLSYHACHMDDIRGGRVLDLNAESPAEFNTYMVRVRDYLK